MLLKKEINIGVDGFAGNDWLNRHDHAESISSLLEHFPRPLVLALDGNWGSGKSHFLKLWVAEHKNWLEKNDRDKNKTTIIYFDAFKYDYLDDPLASLVFELDETIPKNNTKLKEKILAIKGSISPLLATGAEAIAVSLGAPPGIFGGVTKLFWGIINWKKKSGWEKEEERIRAIENFRNAISDLTNEQRLIIIIDELDRCRPDYALKLLEIIKHFFNVPRVNFILGANKKALENSIVTAYGKNIDPGQYLKKFISLTYHLEPLVSEKVVDTNLARVYFDELYNHLTSEAKHHLKDKEGIIDSIQTILTYPKIANQLSLRDIEHIVARLQMFPLNVSFKSITWQSTTLAFIAVLDAINHKWLEDLISDNSEKIIFNSNSIDELFLKKGESLTDMHQNIKLARDTCVGIVTHPDSHQVQLNWVRSCFGNHSIPPS